MGSLILATPQAKPSLKTRRGDLITAINTYYDAELQRINGLKLSEAELQDLREDNTLAREQALRSAKTATNRFAEERISAEMRLQDEIADLRDDAIDGGSGSVGVAYRRTLHARHNETRILDLRGEIFRSDLEDLRRERLQDAQDDGDWSISETYRIYKTSLRDSCLVIASFPLRDSHGGSQQRDQLSIERHWISARTVRFGPGHRTRQRPDKTYEYRIRQVLHPGSAGEGLEPIDRRFEAGEITDPFQS